jgi:tRNA(Leu) C34 or U34 (ribose-2'-O)-methylase TrmL
LIGWGLFFFGSEEQNKPRKTMGDAKKEIEIAMPMLKEVRPNS